MTMHDEDRLVAGTSQERGDNALRPTIVGRIYWSGKWAAKP